MLPCAPLVVAALVHMAGSPLAAPSPDEQRLFAEGLRAFEAGDARGAERAWKAGYAVSHDPAFLVRIGEAEEKAGAPADAAASYRRYLHEAPEAADRADIEQRLARLEPALPPPPAPAAPAPVETPGDFGAASPSAAVPPLPTTIPPGAEEQPPAPAREDLGWTNVRITAWVAAGVAVLALGTSAFFAASAGSKADDVNLLVDYRDQFTGAPLQYSAVAQRYKSAVEDGKNDDRNAKIALGVAGAAAAVSAAAFIFDAVHTPEARVAVAPTGNGNGAMAALRWAF